MKTTYKTILVCPEQTKPVQIIVHNKDIEAQLKILNNHIDSAIDSFLILFVVGFAFIFVSRLLK